MTTATLTDAATVTLAFPLAAAEGLRHAITLAIHERPTSERDMLASIYGALVNPQPAPKVRAAGAPVDVLAVMARRQHGPEVDPDTGADRGSCCEHAWADGWNDCIGNLADARAAVAELIEAAKDVEWNARMTAPDDTYHEVGRKEMSRLTSALARVGGGK